MDTTFKNWINNNCACLCNTACHLMAVINKTQFNEVEAQKLINRMQSIVEDIQIDFDNLNNLNN